MTTWALSETRPARDVLDEQFPGRARRSLESLLTMPCVEHVGPGRYRTTDVDGEIADWLALSTDLDPIVIKAAPGEAVPNAGEAVVREVVPTPIRAPARRAAAKRGRR